MILVLHGSPNKESMTQSIVHEVLKQTDEEVRFIHAYKKDIISCDDCKFCTHKLGCPKDDDMQEIYQLLSEARVLILSSPIYFGAYTNELMKIINRFQRYFSQRFVHKKPLGFPMEKAIGISTAGSDSEAMFDGAKLTFHMISDLFSVKQRHFIYAKNTDEVFPLDDQSLVHRLEGLL